MPGNTYNWTVVGGIFTGQDTNQIAVTWTTAGPDILVSPKPMEVRDVLVLIQMQSLSSLLRIQVQSIIIEFLE